MARRYLSNRIAGDNSRAVQAHQPGSCGNPDLTGDLLGRRRRVLRPLPEACTPEACTRVTPRRQSRRVVSLISVLLVLILAWQWGNAGWILVKAQLAQWLIAQAWDNSQTPGHEPSAQRENPLTPNIKPWPWADTHPVARLRMPDEGVDLFVLEGAQGNSLAFGPGHLQGTALPGDGISVIGGHRDTHFRFLKDIKPGDDLYMQTRDGRQLTYRIERRQVVDSRHTPLQLPDYPASGLVLVTCYPFDAIDPNGPLRLVVWAREVRDADLLPAQQPYPEQPATMGTLSFSL